jgi:putative tryptophan/tyrosine transport system substrate-binding protein
MAARILRREFIVALGGATAPLLTSVSVYPQALRTLRLGVVGVTPRNGPLWVAFGQRLRELGYIEGQNLSIEFIQVTLQDETIRAAMTKLVSGNVDIIITGGNEYLMKAALQATKLIPIVMIAIDYDPLALGYIASLARPGGNVTGLFTQQIDLTAKRLQLIKEVVPGISKMVAFWDRSSAGQWQAAQGDATTLGLQVAGVELREQPYDYERALSEAPVDYRGALVTMMSPIFFNDRERLAEFTQRHGLPSMFGLREWAAAGALLSYGPNIIALFKHQADYVDRIAKGAKPADLPVEQPTKFEFVINMKTAKAFGLTIPPGVLSIADAVIE